MTNSQRLEIAELRSRFLEAMDDDFNTGAAVACLFDLVRKLNKFADAERLEVAAESRCRKSWRYRSNKLDRDAARNGRHARSVPQTGRSASLSADDSLAPASIDGAVGIEVHGPMPRKAKDFATADKIRKRLVELGITLEDRPGGTEWTRKVTYHGIHSVSRHVGVRRVDEANQGAQ